jgi:sporulation protein YlmC with PRC-barrel domain
MTFARIATGLTLSATAALVSGAAFAQEQETDTSDQQTMQQEGGDTTWVDITSWAAAEGYYDGWSAMDLLDEDAYGIDGEDLGEVEDIIVGPDGRIERIVVEGGGFLDIGDTHAAIPWEEVTRTGTSSVTVPVTDDNLGDYTRYPEVDDMPAMGGNFRINEIIGDYVAANGRGYGTIDDVIFTDEGEIQAVIVYPTYGYGYQTRPVAVPYNAGAYDPYAPYYSVPYGTAELDELRPFNYGNFGS